ncbi:transcription elongation factor GreA [Mycoplasmoides pneumoniae]|uniref:transcription elongation factor GreA n=1 Tax=Mycoplasmoides pneumoniae TaxID=2104 RepID=UPI00132F9D80|nr:transcription elongation factor GreA [Mycoplasmoides pneumoniae]
MELNKNYLTEEGLKQLEAELEHLIQVKRPAIIKLLQEARDQGDLSENADYDTAKAQQGEIETRIAEIQDILANVKLINESQTKKANKVTLGSTVEIYDYSSKTHEKYTIVGALEANPEEHRISNESPLAHAIYGRLVDDECDVVGIEVPYRVKIVKIING